MVPGTGIEPVRSLTPRDFKSLASTNSATQAVMIFRIVLQERKMIAFISNSF